MIVQCGVCGKIRTAGHWRKMTPFELQSILVSEAGISHAYCPVCAEEAKVSLVTHKTGDRASRGILARPAGIVQVFQGMIKAQIDPGNTLYGILDPIEVEALHAAIQHLERIQENG